MSFALALWLALLHALSPAPSVGPTGGGVEAHARADRVGRAERRLEPVTAEPPVVGVERMAVGAPPALATTAATPPLGGPAALAVPASAPSGVAAEARRTLRRLDAALRVGGVPAGARSYFPTAPPAAR